VLWGGALLGFAFVIALVYLVGNLLMMERQSKELGAALGAKDPPAQFLSMKIKPGMTKAQVERMVRGHRRVEHHPATDARFFENPRLQRVVPGPTDCYIFEFGPLWGTDVWLSGLNLCVIYDQNGLVRADYAIP
jgi:hypothetical protein